MIDLKWRQQIIHRMIREDNQRKEIPERMTAKIGETHLSSF